MRLQIFLVMILVFLFSFSGLAAKVKLSEDELSSEAIFPVFEEKVVIKNRRVSHKGRLELGVFGGNVMSEALYSFLTYGGSLAYHFDNTHGIFMLLGIYSKELSKNGECLSQEDCIERVSGDQKIFNASLAPHKKFMMGLHYQYTAYYGKISLAKEMIMNLSLYGLIGGGTYIMDNYNAPMMNLGFGQRFYFHRNMAFRLDLLFSIYNGIDITSTGDVNNHEGPENLANPNITEIVKISSFDRKILFDTQINFGLAILF